MQEEKRSKRMLVTDDSFAVLVTQFKASTKFVGYSEATKILWGRELGIIAGPNALGPSRVEELRPSIIQRYLDGLDGKPGKQTAALAALKQLEKWAVVRDKLPRQITTGVETERPQGGHTPWTDEQVALAEQHASPRIARAVTLASSTGQRGSDLIRMGPTDLETYNGIDGINVTQKKTGKQVWIPITAHLAEAMKSWERRPGPFLRQPDGTIWNRNALSCAWGYERRTNKALKSLLDAGLVLHGLRGTACVRLRRAGATTMHIADMVGMSEEMVARYCRLSVQKENASAAIFHLERTVSERNPNILTKGVS